MQRPWGRSQGVDLTHSKEVSGAVVHERCQIAWEGPGHVEPCWLWYKIWTLKKNPKYTGMTLRA